MEQSEKGYTTVSSNQASHQFSSGNQSAQVNLLPMFYTPLAVNWESQEWLSAERNLAQTGMQVPVPVKLGSHQMFSMGNQSIQIEPSYKSQTLMPIFVGLDQLSSSNRQVPGPQSSLNIQPSMPTNLASQFLSFVNKQPTQIPAPSKLQSVMPTNTGSQLSSTNKCPAQLEPPQKVQSELFGSVRSKLRESLAASLAMVSEKKNKQQIGEKSTLGKVSSTEAKMVTSVGDLKSEANAPYDKSALETLVSGGPDSKFNATESLASDISSKEDITGSTVLMTSDVEELQPKDILLQDRVPNDSALVKDELLEGHGLCWTSDLDAGTVDDSVNHDKKRLKMATEQETADKKETTAQNSEDLAFRIEAELFRLFGGVNKKYKEKGRSLLFNLKDRSNPELRERVLSGEIAPERLCKMTAEELASKELSQWRLAKAEELAQMVVLQDSDVDLRRLVKKTHKGEIQVVEQEESFPVEVELGTNVISHVPSKTNEEVKTQSKSNKRSAEPKASERRSSSRKTDLGDQNLPGDLDILHEKTDLMQDLIVDELKDSELLPPVVSLDEFMQALDSEPPFENLSVDSLQQVPSSGVKKLDCLEPDKILEPDSMGRKQHAASGNLESKSDSSHDGSISKLGSSQEGMQSKLCFADDTSKDPATFNPNKVDVMHSRNDDLKSGSANSQSDTCPPKVALTGDKIWEGLIQLNISARATVIGFFRSGEKTSTQEWPSFLEIKGRVRLDAFEKFLKELPLSRSRAIMIIQFCWKEGGSRESGRLNLLEVIDSYMAEERVGYAEPQSGVELYLCPPHSRTSEMLEKCLPKEHAEALQMIADGSLVGVVVWRRPHEITSLTMSSHHMHGSLKKQSVSRKQQSIYSYPVSSIMPSLPLPAGMHVVHTKEDDAGDVPPGFGPKDDDDLPEFSFVDGRTRTPKHVTSQRPGLGVTHPRPRPRPHVLPPVDQIRELIHKYGQSEIVKEASIDDEDDIPEWRPQQDYQLRAQSLKLPPPPPHLHAHQRQTLQSIHVNQQMVPMPLQQQTLPHPRLASMAALPPLIPQVAIMPGTSPIWRQMALSGVPVDIGLSTNNVMQTYHYNAQPNVDGQMYSLPNLGSVQNVMGWRPDVFGSGGI